MPQQQFIVFPPAPHADIFAMVLQIGLLLLTARVLGEFAQRLKQPSVVGEIAAGILLGPSVLGFIFPDIAKYLIPTNPTQGHLLEALSLIGAIFLLLITGLETDLKLIQRHARTALGVSFGGISVTFTTGFFLGQYLPDYLLVDPQERLVFSLFIATSMSISAIPVIAKVLIDLNLTRRDIGQTIIAAGMSDDTIGWILLSVVAGLAAGEKVSPENIFGSIGVVVAFLAFSFTLGRWLVKKTFDIVQDKAVSTDRLLSLVVVMAFLWASITQALHLEAVLGAFVMGILFSRIPRLPNDVHHKLESIALSIFAPIFFATAGLKVNIKGLLSPDLIIITLLVIAVASIGKVVGTYVGARVIGRKDHWTALSFGAALNARGAMEIIVATIGLSLGILSQEMFSIIVVMAVTTSLITPSALHWALRRVAPSNEETQRLKQEEMTLGSPIMNIHRVLVPIRYRENDAHLNAMQLVKSRILHNIGMRNKLSLTLLCVEHKNERQARDLFLGSVSSAFKEHELIERVVAGKDVVHEVLKESEKDYDLLLMGAAAKREKSKYVFSKIIDDLIRLSPCNSIVVHANKFPENWSPDRILVPTNGSSAARSAVELAFMIAATGTETVKILNVVERPTTDLYEQLHDENFRRRLKIAADILKPLRQLGELKGVNTIIDAVPGPSTEKMILEIAEADKVDLIIMGTNVRPASEHLFLGPQIEHILENASCPVITLNSV
jgi:Kef-type K+ transport system membrane component KefB/nucleotide-binding universal stress UspA family protein